MIKEYAQKDLTPITKAVEATRLYSVALLYPDDINPMETIIGSGTLAIISGKIGVLTSEHVSKIFREKQSQYIYVPYIDTNLKALKISMIISLPAKSDTADVDIAFIILDDSAHKTVEQLGKEFRDCDQEAREWKEIIDATGHLWVVHGNVDENKEILNDDLISERIILNYCNAGAYIVVPDHNKTGHEKVHYRVFGLNNLRVDNIICSIKTIEITPRSFEGMSGGGLWRVSFDTNDKVKKVTLAGIVAAQKGYRSSRIGDCRRKKAKKIICHGPIALYESFYPFCFEILSENSF